ncbi:PREDICTED: chorion class B protein M3A5-like [Papilio xuthus]|uniref:Chorion class B protein M3A5-like n=1 Tax=Papilio xuthus TaxID=66420 RepID=A0AAJ7EFP6_PAPXU|nr:PREDICTED: chorion class B protein M3A5-like [Papilio xuthus]
MEPDADAVSLPSQHPAVVDSPPPVLPPSHPSLPFLGTVGLEGALPTAGAGAVSYGCGNGAVGMVSEDIAAPAWGYPAAAGLGYGPGLAAGIGYGPAIAGRAFGGCGCGIY